jgi:hypothetical protein
MSGIVEWLRGDHQLSMADRQEAADEIERLQAFYEVAKRFDIWIIAKAQNNAADDARTDYRFYLGLYERELDEAVQIVEDWRRDNS